jgi:hypothetical protein
MLSWVTPLTISFPTPRSAARSSARCLGLLRAVVATADDDNALRDFA